MYFFTNCGWQPLPEELQVETKRIFNIFSTFKGPKTILHLSDFVHFLIYAKGDGARINNPLGSTWIYAEKSDWVKENNRFFSFNLIVTILSSFR